MIELVIIFSYLFEPNVDIQDCNGVIENEELKGFLKDLLELARKVIIIC